MEHNAKILLADDSHAIRFLVSEILTNAGFTVIEAEDGQEAIDKTYKENPDLLILDYEMPHKTGFDVVREVRSRTGYLHTPIIIFTAVSDKSTKLEGLGLDIDDYLTKPADEDEIVARVKLLLKRNKQKWIAIRLRACRGTLLSKPAWNRKFPPGGLLPFCTAI